MVSGVFDFDPAAIRGKLRELLQRPDLTGDVYLTGAEHGEFRATLLLQDGGGTLTLTTDQSHVREALRQIESALRHA